MISDCVAKYTRTMQKLRLQSGYTCTCIDVVHRPTPESCDDYLK